MPDTPPGPAAEPTPLPDKECRPRNTDGGGRRTPIRRWAVAIPAAVLALVVVLVVQTSDGGDPESVAPGTAAEQSDGANADEGTDLQPEEDTAASPTEPPYVAVPEFSSDTARDVAFVADVAPFSTWPIGVESYDAMSSSPGGSDISDFRKAVIADAESVCDALMGGTDMDDVPAAVGLHLQDEIDQAAFIVEAVTFYCPDQMASVTADVYSKPVPTEQDENCPTASALKAKAVIGERSDAGDGIRTAAYTVEVHNTSSYDVRVQLQQRWFADGFADDGVWGPFGDASADHVITVKANETFAYEAEQSGIYRWNRTEVRVQPGEFVFLGCGYQPGPGTAAEG